MRIGKVNGSFLRQDRPAQHGAPDARKPARPESRALVVTGSADTPSEHAFVYRPAAFLAHLIATKTGQPQTRERRRADPSEAIAAYRATAELMKS